MVRFQALARVASTVALSCFLPCATHLAWTLRAFGDQPPNVVLIMADDMGYSDLGCYGGEIDTPALDELAGGGLRFTQFYNTGRCWTTRAALLTGLYPHQAGHAWIYGASAPPAYRGNTPQHGLMIQEVLKTVGYDCYHVGKWHLNNSSTPNETWPLGRGFDRSYYLRTQNTFFNPQITAPHFPLHALPHDIEKFRGRYRQGWDVIRRERLNRQHELGIVSCDLSPRDPDAPAWDSLSEEEQKMWDERMALHAAMIHCIDRGVGRVVEQLEATGALENTLVLFLSDNGASAEYIVRGDGNDLRAPPGSADTFLCMEVGWSNAANTPLRMHKIWMHEGGIATPLIAHWPRGIAARGKLTHHVGHVIDILPTVVELAGGSMPKRVDGRPTTPVTGLSLLPVFRDQKCQPHEFLFWEHTGNRAIRHGDWKLVAEHQGPWELYDLHSDRGESANLAASRPELVDRLRNLWQQYADEIGVVPLSSLSSFLRALPQGYRKK
jgi:arylsulfatase